MSDKKIDYRAEGLLFLKLKESGEKVTQAKFCDRRSEELGVTMSLPYLKKILGALKGKKKPSKKTKKKTGGAKKQKVTPKEQKVTPEKQGVASVAALDWPALKEEFIRGKFKTVSAFARSRGMDPEHTTFRRNTVGWRKDKEAAIKESTGKAIQAFVEEHAIDETRNMHVEVLATQWKLFDVLKDAADAKSNWKGAASPSASREMANFVIDMQRAFERIMPNIKGLEKMTDMRAIFDGLADGTMDIEEAAIGCVRLGVQMPEPLKMMLQKHQPEEAPPDDGDEITEEEILARRQEMMVEIETERVEFVAERKKAVVQIKEDLSHVDSFGEDGDGPKEEQ